jgi:hypothetical protein
MDISIIDVVLFLVSALGFWKVWPSKPAESPEELPKPRRLKREERLERIKARRRALRQK